MNRYLAEMTWSQVAHAVGAGSTTVILPLGATEQHGPHLPLGTDTFRATALAARFADALPEALVAPALPFGCSDEHSGFPGLIGLDHTTLASVIVDCARRMAAWGMRRLILLSAHGGNDQALALAIQQLAYELPDLQVWATAGMQPQPMALPSALLDIARADGIAPEAVGLHAGEWETSEMLYLRPDLVQMERAAPGYTGDMAAILPELQASGLHPVTPNGILGDPRGAMGERGERYLVALASEYLSLLSCAPQVPM